MEDKNYYSRTGYVSNSSLNCLIESPKLFKLYLEGKLEEKDTNYFKFGQLVHLKVLEPYEYDRTVIVYDYEKPKSAQQEKFINKITKLDGNADFILIQIYREVYPSSSKDSDSKILDKATELVKKLSTYHNYCRLSQDKTVISTKESQLIELINEKCNNHKAASQLLKVDTGALGLGSVSEYNEKEILWLYKGVKCKSLVDRIVVDKVKKVIKLIDFKTTAKLHSFKDSYINFGYDRQLAFYKMAIENSFSTIVKDSNVDEYTFEYYIIAACTKVGTVKAFKIDNVDEAEKVVTEALERAKWHIDSDKFDHSMEYYTGDGLEQL